MNDLKVIKIRNGKPFDYDTVVAVMDEWWGRKVSVLQQRLFFDHFTETVFIAENSKEEMIGFINGFISQSESDTAYIHFVGVDPFMRGSGLGRKLYENFFDYCHNRGIKTIKSITSKVISSVSQRF